MKCKLFEHHLPDWIGKRLPFALAQQMQAHQASCSACRQAANLERTLRTRWQELPTPPVNATLWTRLAQQIETVPQQRPRRLLPVWAMGSAMAMGMVICVMLWTHAPSPQLGTAYPNPEPIVQSADDNHIVQMVSEVQQLSDGESDSFISETQQDRQAMRRLLQGKEGH